MDYQGNAKKDKEKVEKAIEKPKNEPVVSGKVMVKKKSIGRRFRDLFVEADFRSVIRYVISDVLLPAARNTIVDASTKGIERMMYGESASRRRLYGGGTRITYNNPINRGREPGGRHAPPVTSGPRTSPSRRARDDYVLASREEAELVLERMNDIIDTYEVVSVADLNELVDMPTSYIDNQWGWNYLADVQVRQIREGYLIDLPPAEHL